MNFLQLGNNNYGRFLFLLVIFGSAIDTSIGLNFLLLFVLVTLAHSTFFRRPAGTKMPEAHKVACLLFALTYGFFLLSELVNTGELGEVSSVAVNYSVYALLGFILLSCYWQKITFESLSSGIGIIAILYAIIALIEAYTYQTPRVAFGYNSIPLGMIAVQLLFWCGCVTLTRRQGTVISLLGLVCASWVIYLTGSRMPIAVMLLLLVLWLLFSKQPVLTRLCVLLGCLLIIPIQSTLTPFGLELILTRFSLLDIDAVMGLETGSASSGVQRSWIWQSGAEMISQSPWFGWGHEATLTKQALAAVNAPASISVQPHFHNELIDMAVRFGLPAAGGLIVAYLSLFRLPTTRQQFWVVFVFLGQMFALSLTDIISNHSVTLSMFAFSVTLLLLYTSPSLDDGLQQ
ncbi:O-antigen ligase family protein [Octadecabacter ascidiaceicola]|uniref:O-Antigen ligase n=1 Tax=Octadecabacter ascidiaceicola TaxID=1655543 RepID=A0A238KRG7_9RHOB|nr:O-antigen ligase family protein [Octadecabacter ascidiaceicola]SMX45277.1 O-Antigen ligase [Octadecabacter ascidiaceicola]